MIYFMIEFALALVIIYILTTQIIVPTWRETTWFPIFKRQRKIEKEIRELQQEMTEQWLEGKTTKLKNNLNRKKKSQ